MQKIPISGDHKWALQRVSGREQGTQVIRVHTSGQSRAEQAALFLTNIHPSGTGPGKGWGGGAGKRGHAWFFVLHTTQPTHGARRNMLESYVRAHTRAVNRYVHTKSRIPMWRPSQRPRHRISAGMVSSARVRPTRATHSCCLHHICRVSPSFGRQSGQKREPGP